MAGIAKRQRLNKARRRQRRQCQTRQNRKARILLRTIHNHLPTTARTLVDHLAHVFTTPTALRFAILTIGTHTVANLLRTLAPFVPGDAST